MWRKLFKPVASKHFIRMQGEDKAQITLATTFMWALPRGRIAEYTNALSLGKSKQMKSTPFLSHIHNCKQVRPNNCCVSMEDFSSKSNFKQSIFKSPAKLTFKPITMR